MRRICVLIVAGALAGCAGTLPVAMARFDAPRRARVFEVALEELARRQLPVERADPPNGIIESDWAERPEKIKCGFLTCAYRDRVQVNVSPDGLTTLQLERQIAIFTVTGYSAGFDWYPPTQQRLKDDIVAEQKAMLEAISAAVAAQ